VYRGGKEKTPPFADSSLMTGSLWLEKATALLSSRAFCPFWKLVRSSLLTASFIVVGFGDAYWTEKQGPREALPAVPHVFATVVEGPLDRLQA